MGREMHDLGTARIRSVRVDIAGVITLHPATGLISTDMSDNCQDRGGCQGADQRLKNSAAAVIG